jgi:hypothetical protein
VDELKLVKGDMAYAVIKASDVMVAKEVRRPGTAHTPADEVTGRRGSPSGLTAS